ncbi:MAG: hypothetical protein OZ919_06720, partial [Xanthomonadaceae bacterium]|nr:hypothetical protein [Xanthomonadaceae bacterium]
SSRDPVSGGENPSLAHRSRVGRGRSPFDHSSRRRFAARLNSGVSYLETYALTRISAFLHPGDLHIVQRAEFAKTIRKGAFRRE